MPPFREFSSADGSKFLHQSFQNDGYIKFARIEKPAKLNQIDAAFAGLDFGNPAMGSAQAGCQGALGKLRGFASDPNFGPHEGVFFRVRRFFHCSDYRDDLQCSQIRSRRISSSSSTLTSQIVRNAMDEFEMSIPTFYGASYGDPTAFAHKEEFDEPYVPLLASKQNGMRIVLGATDSEDGDSPDIHIERRPNGWAIFLHPRGEGDPSGYVYFLDDGRSYLVPVGGPSDRIRVLDDDETVPMIDDPPQMPLLSSPSHIAKTQRKRDSDEGS